MALVDAYRGMAKLASNQLRKTLYENAIVISNIYSDDKQVAELGKNLNKRYYRMLANSH